MISSKQNDIFKKLLSLTKSKGIKEHGQCLVSGEKITAEVSRLTRLPFFWVHSEDQSLPDGDWKKSVQLSKDLFKELDVCGTHKPLLCVDYHPIKTHADLDNSQAAVYCALSDPTNLGALVRTCAAFGLEQMVLLDESGHPYLPKSIRAASGSSLSMKFFKGPSIKDLKSPDLLALDMKGQSLDKVVLKKDMKFLVGEEGQGVPSSFPGQRVHLPITNKVESLNATIAASLLVYEWSKV
ncbi:MAG: RNA methyltransferase [Bdellovibrionales bacterium]|nr:RNA methyltransferase [Bdellovibrionales bacterium]NQZ19106.1 RNA methyltransferase [Bdellovibrionales bacterium]